MSTRAAIASTGAGMSLVAAAAVLVIAVSGFVAFRGFETPRATSAVRQDARLAVLDATVTPRPQRVVVGARSTARRPAGRRADQRPAVRRGPSRVLTSPDLPRQTGSQRIGTPLVKRAVAAPDRPKPDSPPPVAQVRDEPVEELVAEVDRSAETLTEKVGDALLDVRDAMP